jgi:hypothetical protein
VELIRKIFMIGVDRFCKSFALCGIGRL